MDEQKEKIVSKEKKTKPEEKDSWTAFKENSRAILGAVTLALVIRIIIFEPFLIDGSSMEPTLLDGDRVLVGKFYYGLFLPFADSALLTWALPDEGDIVIVKSPHDNKDVIKRVIGLPGDIIDMKQGVLYKNGIKLTTGKGHTHQLRGRNDRNAMLGESCDWAYEEKVGEVTYETYQLRDGVLFEGVPSSITYDKSALRQCRIAYENSPIPPLVPYELGPCEVPEGHLFIMGDHRIHSKDSKAYGVIPADRLRGKAMVVFWSSSRLSTDGWLEGIRWDRTFLGL